MNLHTYRKISIIIFNSKRFQVFMDEKNRYAFLEIDKKGNYIFPKLEDFIGLINIFVNKNTNEYYYRKINNKSNKFVFRASVLLAASVITCSSILLNVLKEENKIKNTDVSQIISIEDNYEEEKQTLPIEVNEEDQELIYISDDMYNIYEKQIDIYNSIALNKFLGEKNISINDIEEAINNNSNLNEDIKQNLKDFSITITEYYPTIDMRLFYENIKRLNIMYETDEAIQEHGNELAWYNCETGEIHINENIKPIKGSKDAMILRHEFGHMISQAILPYEDKNLVVITKNGAYGEYFQEAFNVIITTNPYLNEYDFTDYGYNLNTNELRAIINCIPNFDISVLANQDIYNISDYLDRVNPNTIPAYRLIDLMDIQTIAYNNIGTMEVDDNEFNEIYEYIANTYTNNVLTPDMSYNEIISIQEDLIKELNNNLGYTGNLTNYQIIINKFTQYIEEQNITKDATLK